MGVGGVSSRPCTGCGECSETAEGKEEERNNSCDLHSEILVRYAASSCQVIYIIRENATVLGE